MKGDTRASNYFGGAARGRASARSAIKIPRKPEGRTEYQARQALRPEHVRDHRTDLIDRCSGEAQLLPDLLQLAADRVESRLNVADGRALATQFAEYCALIPSQLAVPSCLPLLKMPGNCRGIPQLADCILQTAFLGPHQHIANGPREIFGDDFVGVVLVIPGSTCGAEFTAVTFIDKPTEPRKYRVTAVRVDDWRHFRKAPAVNTLIHINDGRGAEIERPGHRAAPSTEKELIRQDIARLDVGGHPGRVLRRDPQHAIRDSQFLYQRTRLSDGFAPVDKNGRSARTRGFDEPGKSLDENVVAFFPARMALRLPMLTRRVKNEEISSQIPA